MQLFIHPSGERLVARDARIFFLGVDPRNVTRQFGHVTVHTAAVRTRVKALALENRTLVNVRRYFYAFSAYYDIDM